MFAAWVPSAQVAVDSLKDATARGLNAIVCTHVPPSGWVNASEFEGEVVSAGCVRAVVVGHAHRNQMTLIGGIPVLIRTANVTSPFGYTVLHLFEDGRIVVVQKSQHFPYDDFIIGDNIAYRLVLEVHGGRVRASWKNMLDLEAQVDAGAAGQFGFFVERGVLFVTDLKLESVQTGWSRGMPPELRL